KTELFARGIGDATDIVEKEMYTFHDAKGRSLSLRPEATASVIRAFIQHQLHTTRERKFFLIGPMFRHERPQAGRFRQFHQIGAEALGSDHPALDAELLALLDHFFHELKIQDLVLHLNTIGDRICRPLFRERFKAFMEARARELCQDCHVRLLRNPLRILDCKNEGCQRVAEKAPRPIHYLCEGCAEHWRRLESLLQLLKIDYLLNDRLVRGLDYYTRTTFEFINPALGAQNALAGGGRYDELVEELGGPPTPGIGFALGMERVVASLPEEPSSSLPSFHGIFIATLGAEAFQLGMRLLQELRRKGFRAAIDFEGRSLKGQLRQAHKDRFRFSLILGDEELRKGGAILRDMERGEQVEVPIAQVMEHLLALQESGVRGRGQSEEDALLRRTHPR
ncbi:MAG: histidine--tRNA ligase, partial [Candidatus Methylomirabilales bacterium]